MIYTIDLSDAQNKSLSYVAVSPDEWIQNAVSERCRIATDDIVKICVEKCLETSTPIPGSKDDMVELAFYEGWVKSAAQRKAEDEADAVTKAALEEQAKAE